MQFLSHPTLSLSGSSPSKGRERQHGQSLRPRGATQARDFLTLSADLDLLPYFKPRAAAKNKHACVITILDVEQFDHVCV